MSHNQYTCPNPDCGHVSNYYWHRLSPGLVGTLIKMRRAIRARGSNSVHLVRDLTGSNELSKTEYNNAQKLRLHAMIAHSDEGSGFWLLTSRGRKFLDGEIAVPRSVQTLNNQVKDHDRVLVTVVEVMQTKPAFDDYDFWHSQPQHDSLQVRMAL